MGIPLQITFRNMPHSESIEAAVRQRVARLERFSHRITNCHVLIDVPHKSQQHGNHYSVRIDIRTPSGDVAVTRDPVLDGTHQDFRTVLRDAFDTATRHMEDDLQRQRVLQRAPSQA